MFFNGTSAKYLNLPAPQEASYLPLRHIENVENKERGMLAWNPVTLEMLYHIGFESDYRSDFRLDANN
jgi:hypothetical protein